MVVQKQNTTSDWVDIHIKSRIDAGELLAALDDPANNSPASMRDLI